MNKIFIKNLIFLLIVSFVVSFFSASTSLAASGSSPNLSYTPMEAIPGYGSATSFPTYIGNIYKFGLWTIGICAMLMIMIGGFMYLTSAGNVSQAGKAQGIITDAIIGIILALISWLLLYTINPDLVKYSGGTSSGGGSGATGSGTTPGSGKCTPVSTGACSVSNLQNTCFGSNATQASSICNKESSGTTTALSGTDKCTDGNSFSVGLFQINLTVHKINGLDCPSAFSGKNYSCKVVNQDLYNQCVTAAQDPNINISKACSISNNGAHWGQWGANKTCRFNN